MSRRTLVRGGVLVMGATLAWHVSNFVFTSATARLLGPSRYGTLAAVVAIMYVTSPMLSSVLTVVSRMTSERAARGAQAELRQLVRWYVLRLGAVAALLSLAGAALARPVASFLGLPSATPLVILSVSFAFSILSSVQRGVLQGLSAFGRYTASTLVEAIVKVVAAVALVGLVWRSENAAVLAILLASATALLAGVPLLRFLPRLPAGAVAARIRNPFGYSMATLGSLTLLSALFSMDVVAAKHYLPPHEAGIYAAVSMCGKVAFFVTSAISLVSFPFFSSRHEAGRDTRTAFGWSVAFVAGAGVVLAAFYFALPSVPVRILFGSDYLDAGRYIGWMAIAITFYAVCYQGTTYLLAQKAASGAVVLAVAEAAQLVLLYRLHNGIWTILVIQLAVLAAATAGIGILCVQVSVRHARKVAPAAHGV